MGTLCNDYPSPTFVTAGLGVLPGGRYLGGGSNSTILCIYLFLHCQSGYSDGRTWLAPVQQKFMGCLFAAGGPWYFHLNLAAIRHATKTGNYHTDQAFPGIDHALAHSPE